MLVEKEHPWASRKPSKRALQLAFYSGILTVSARDGMLKTYDLMARHFGWNKTPKAASEREISEYLLDRALRCQGIVSLNSVCYLDAKRKPAILKLIKARVRRGELVPLELEGSAKPEHWAEPTAIETANDIASEMVHILSPFDPLIIHRKRAELFFGYAHRFRGVRSKGEASFRLFRVASPRGRRDRRGHRPQNGSREAGIASAKMDLGGGRAPREGVKRRIEEELQRFERFQLAV